MLNDDDEEEDAFDVFDLDELVENKIQLLPYIFSQKDNSHLDSLYIIM